MLQISERFVSETEQANCERMKKLTVRIKHAPGKIKIKIDLDAKPYFKFSLEMPLADSLNCEKANYLVKATLARIGLEKESLENLIKSPVFIETISAFLMEGNINFTLFSLDDLILIYPAKISSSLPLTLAEALPISPLSLSSMPDFDEAPLLDLTPFLPSVDASHLKALERIPYVSAPSPITLFLAAFLAETDTDDEDEKPQKFQRASY